MSRARRVQNALSVIFGFWIVRYARLGRPRVILLVSTLSTGAFLVLIAVLFKGRGWLAMIILVKLRL